MKWSLLVVVGALLWAPAARAGLYYSGEPFAELPSQWRGFLLDYRMLRQLAVKPAPKATPLPARARYEEAAAKLAKAAKERPLTPDEAADLGALYVRLGEVAKALEVLRPAQRDRPTHFHLAANLGTAWQLQGDLSQAAAALQLAVKLAPGKYLRAEELHLKMVRQRLHERPGTQPGLDELFGARYIGPSGKFEVGRISADERKRLPSDAVALVQQLALWLPADGRLLWQLAELAGAHGDVNTAAAMLDGCVTEFGLRHPDLLAHRQAFRTAADERSGAPPDARAAHEGHVAVLKPRSSRPLANRIDLTPLPPIDPKGTNPLPWSVIAETTLDRQYRPTFAGYLKELDGKQVQLTGFMQPLNNEQEVESFLLIEYPVGCWYCEAPEVTGIMLVELPAGKSRTFTRSQVRVTGRLKLNATDPESFLYVVQGAKVIEGD
jgi:hypothetical protein